MFFDSWTDVGRIFVLGPAAYLMLVALLRVSGKRTLSKMNAFDFVVTVSFGSTLASVLLSEDISLAEGTAAFIVLIFGQYLITALSTRSERFQRLVKSEPTLLARGGQLLKGKMRRERVSEEEVYAALREHGYATLDEVAAVVLETNGSVSMIESVLSEDAGAMRNVEPEGI